MQLYRPTIGLVLTIGILIIGSYFHENKCLAVEINAPGHRYPITLGGTLQVDYRNISDQARADSRFDIRRARMNICGQYLPNLSYELEFEFQGNATKRLVDAYGRLCIYQPSLYLQFGQFKMPFSREWLIEDKAFPFAERSIGYTLQPGRDVGVMLGGEILNGLFLYNLGIFNGDGIDGSSRGNQKDEPELAMRCVVYPLAHTDLWGISPFFGVSFTESRIDTTNVQVQAKSTGMIGTLRNVYELKSHTKFGNLLDVNKRQRKCLESGLIAGPMAFYAEYQRFQYKDLKPVGEEPSNANIYTWYTSLVINLNGMSMSQPLSPKKKTSVDIWQAAFRREYFSGDANWIKAESFNAAKEANAYSLALSWMRIPYYRILIDYTYTDISDPIRIRVNPDSTIEYMTSETSVTMRFQINM
ncbi:MAG: Phosphate-selective porin O and P [Candidatus Magnetoglobus multicellularis str. Araruama]|uniref:Phosphate-selective porin O and P n=1 Tax=Candidatus Magnetoglobus multicellularis str. Araruama TaxID=890399 RepID=A0A1V1PEM9_9BACT|nr:MAG: Phosphate-selective porin O and P [Candidatus Magnetoglobus multicellularis str. Araruama]